MGVGGGGWRGTAGHQTRSGAEGLNVGQATAGDRREEGDRLQHGVGGAVR